MQVEAWYNLAVEGSQFGVTLRVPISIGSLGSGVKVGYKGALSEICIQYIKIYKFPLALTAGEHQYRPWAIPIARPLALSKTN